jgi:hypothetical protein
MERKIGPSGVLDHSTIIAAAVQPAMDQKRTLERRVLAIIV